MKNLLIICFDIEDIKKLKKVDKSKYSKVIVATDDIRVQNECNNNMMISDVTFLSKPIPYTNVANVVIEIIEKINTYFEEVSQNNNEFKKEIMQWPINVEGGNNTQIIQDSLLYIECLHSIVIKFNIYEILIISNVNYKLWDTIVKEYSLSYNIKFIFKKNYLLPISKKDLKNTIKPFYYLTRTLYIKARFGLQKNKNTNKHKIALLWLYNNSKKHIDNSLFISNLLSKANYNPLLYSWSLGKINNYEFKKNKINIIRVETYLTWKNILKSVNRSIIILSKKNRYFNVLDNYSFIYRNVQLNNIIKSIVFNYLINDVPDHYRFYKGFLSLKNDIQIFITTGELNKKKIGQIVEYCLPIENISKFTLSTFITNKNLYEEHRRKKYTEEYLKHTIFFVKNDSEKEKILDELDIVEQNVIVCGSPKSTVKLNISKIDAIKKLQINRNFDYLIFFDYPNQLLGYQSTEENVSTLITVLNFVSKYTHVGLLIKPHPSANLTALNNIKKLYNSTNIFYLDRKDSPDLGLIASDILITKCSTLGLEAFKYNTNVISVQFDGSDIFKLYDDLALYVYSTKELWNKLEELFCHDNTYENLYLKLNHAQQNFLAQNYKTVDKKLIIKKLEELHNST